MPVPRLFEAPDDPRERWVHVLAGVLALSGPATRGALVAELAGEELPDAGSAQVRERVRAGGAPVDIVVRDRDGRWTVGVQAALAFGDEDLSGRASAALSGLASTAERAVVVALSPDRRPPADAAPGLVHRSWLRVRDWVQERPERGAAEGVDLLLLREAEYFLTPRVAELYRLEGPMALLAPSLRPTFAACVLELNDLAPAPRIAEAPGEARVTWPRSGDPSAELHVSSGALRLRLATDAAPATAAGEGEGWSGLVLEDAEGYRAARGWALASARELLGAPRTSA
jgi:hypothetical protein